ncbi:FtsH protease activity modulator HflK [Oricola thermophila]|uniref:Protein HflK n=1 Tax=Oricola thermophila TaxID=2742145 RepID=A0A6N1V9R5_9HYPH|nr:FtsH protease activity modulator HflK [Oricola thermophila]QKV17263.1 FtsH protease activity modulator HflK [Oricola thermophila]
MPWSNQNGGGGPWGGGGNNGGGPWGQGPSGPRGPQRGGGGQPPDLEEIIKRGQDRLKRAMPGGGGFSPALFGLIGIGLLVLYGLQAFYQVDTDERAVELLFGKPKAELSTPGLHFHFWPVETVEKVPIVEKQVAIGKGGTGLMLSGDQNIVDVQFAVLYSVVDPASYLFNVESPDDMVRQVAESAMREIVGRRPAQDVFRDDRAGIATDVRASMQQTLDGYGAGIQVNTVSIEDAAPPREVADAFEEVQRAEQNEDQFREEANQYSNKVLGEARGEAAQILEDASAYATRVVQEAEGEAQRFISIYEQYRLAPDVTRKRLYLETMESVLADSNKVILDEGGGGQGVVPYLPLPEVQNRRTTTSTGDAQ